MEGDRRSGACRFGGAQLGLPLFQQRAVDAELACDLGNGLLALFDAADGLDFVFFGMDATFGSIVSKAVVYERTRLVVF